LYHLQFMVSSSFWAPEIELELGDSRGLAGEKAVLLGGSAEYADTFIGFTDIADIISNFRSKRGAGLTFRRLKRFIKRCG